MNIGVGSRWRDFGRTGRFLLLAIALSLLASLVGSTGCATGGLSRSRVEMEGEFRLDSPNFRTTVTHAVGRGSCHYVLFSIPLCRRQDIASVAWEEMRGKANLEGQSGQLVNVFEDRYLRNNLFRLYFQEVYTVSANVIVFE
jgi:hypothetical protein